MNLKIQDCTFDSELFGYSVGSVFFETINEKKLRQIAKIVQSKKYRLLYLTSLKPVDLLMDESRFFLVDEKTTFEKKVDLRDKRASNLLIENAQKYTKDLYELALESGLYSRFKIDPNFKDKEFEKMYKCWLTNSLNGHIAEKVFITKNQQGQENGLLTLAKKERKSVIGLVAVKEKKKGIGRQLIQAAIQQTQVWGLDKIEVTTQGQNKAACRFYEACGFQKKQVSYVYHWWGMR